MSLIAWYPLNGSLEDYSGNKNDLIAYSDFISDNSGKIGKCYKSLTTVSYASTKNNFYLNNNLSMCVWFKLDAYSTSPTAIITNHDHNTTSNFGINLASNKIAISIGYTDGTREWSNRNSKTTIELNKWYHVAITYKKSNRNLKLYVNGILEYNGNLEKDVKPLERPLQINRWSFNYSSYTTTGRYNDIRIYNHELSVKEIKEIYKAKILHYKFDDPYEEPTVNLTNPQDKVVSTTINPGWDSSRHVGAVQVENWSTGYNGGVTSPSQGYHAHWVLENNKPIMKFINKNNSDGLSLGYRWLGIASDISSSKFTAGKVYTISWEQRVDEINQGIWIGLYHRLQGGTSNSFHNGSLSDQKTNKNINVWEKKSYTFTLSSNYDNTTNPSVYVYGNRSSGQGIVYVKNVQIEEKNHDTPFINGSRTGGIKDCSGFRNHGTCSTYPKWVNQSPSGTGSFEFNDNTIECKGSVLPTSSSQEWTVSCWVKFKSNPTTVQYLTNTNLGVRLHNSSTKALNYINNGTNDWYKYSAIISNPTDWFHFASTFNQQTDTIKIWINGVNRTDTGPNNSGGTKQTAGVSSIFKMFSGFIGYASDFRLYATELSDQDIKELYETKASVSKNNKLFVNEIVENKNYADIMNDAINKKQFVNGLTGYEQTHCKVTITDDGYRIYRTPNVNPSTNGNVMWGGVKLQFPEGTFQKGRKYKLSVLVKGKTSNAIGVPYLTPQMGWTAGGLTSLNASSVINIPSNFNSDTYQYFEAVFDLINFEPYQTASKTESIFTQGKTYNCCRDLAWGFSYTDTGSLGTDLYFKDFSLTDITDLNNTKVNKKGQLETKEIIEFNFKPTLIDYSKWTIGTGSVGDWSQNGTNSENKRIVKTNPKGNLDIVWATEANDSTSDADGGWNISGKSIDTTKKYRFTCWIKRENTGNGRTYFGCTASTVCNLGTTTVNTNPYFYNGLISDAPEMGETWCLFVAYIHPHDYTGTSDSTNGFYRGDTKARTRGCGDFKWSSTATTSGVRSYLYYSTSTEERQYWYRPRFEMCDGTEPSINTLLNCCEHLPLVNNKGVPISIDNFSINKDGSCKSNEFIEC